MPLITEDKKEPQPGDDASESFRGNWEDCQVRRELIHRHRSMQLTHTPNDRLRSAFPAFTLTLMVWKHSLLQIVIDDRGDLYPSNRGCGSGEVTVNIRETTA